MTRCTSWWSIEHRYVWALVVAYAVSPLICEHELQSTFESIRIVEGLPESIIGSRTGTKILLDGFDPAWFRGLTLRSIALEIERHFETLLQRKNLTVRVTHASGSQPVVEHVCQPFDYERLPGIRLKSIVPVVEHGKSCKLSPASEEGGGLSFFCFRA